MGKIRFVNLVNIRNRLSLKYCVNDIYDNVIVENVDRNKNFVEKIDDG